MSRLTDSLLGFENDSWPPGDGGLILQLLGSLQPFRQPIPLVSLSSFTSALTTPAPVNI